MGADPISLAAGSALVGGVANAAGGGKNSAPAPPDFSGAAQKQAAASEYNVNQQTAQNRPDQTNAFGATSDWMVGPDGKAVQRTSFGGPLAQGVQNLEGQIGSQGPLGTGDQARDQAIDATYSQIASRLDPQFAQREEQTRSRLLAQGLDPGSQAYDNEMGNFDRARNDAYASAANNAINQGLQAQQVTFGQNLQAQNNPYQQLNMLSGLTGQQGFQAAGRAETPQYLQALEAQYGGQKDKYSADQAGKNGLMGGLSQAAPLALMASDARLKMNIQRLSEEAMPGVRFATWEWRDGRAAPTFGVIAQDLEKVAPHLVHRGSDGFLMVDYSFLRE